MKTLKDIGEITAINRLSKSLKVGPDIIQGVGDDCAVVRSDDSNFDLLLTSDPVIEDVHFTAGTPPAGIGHKAVGRCLSDIAAMGGEPLWALINVVAPPDTQISYLEEIYAGARKLADKYDLTIVGGDLSHGKYLELHVFVVGRVPAGSAILRSGAKPGDIVYVTGSLGASIVHKNISFEPRVTEGIWLRTESWPTSLIDVSDGLARDLQHITTMSKTGAELSIKNIPLSSAALDINDGTTPLDHALYDGEDFELLFTVPCSKQNAFESSWKDVFDLKCTRIGSITDKTGIIELVDDKGKRSALKDNGYDHFKTS